MFYTDGQNLEIEDIPSFTDGYAVTKFKNIDTNGNQGVDSSGNFVDTDLALIRLPEIYLNYAEATLRGGGGDLNLATAKVNELIERGYGNSDHNVTSGNLTLEFILDERSRELYWEGQRRTDLVRYGYFTSSNYFGLSRLIKLRELQRMSLEIFFLSHLLLFQLIQTLTKMMVINIINYEKICK